MMIHRQNEDEQREMLHQRNGFKCMSYLILQINQGFRKLKRLSANPVELEDAIKRYGKMVTKRLDEAGIDYKKVIDENKENVSTITSAAKTLPVPIVNQPTPDRITVQRAELAEISTPKVTSLDDMRKVAASNVNTMNLDSLDTPCTKMVKQILASEEEKTTTSTQQMMKSTDEFDFTFESTPTVGKAKKGLSISSRLSIDTADLLDSTKDELGNDDTNIDLSQMVDEEVGEASMLVNPTDSVADITAEKDVAATPNQAAMKELFKEDKQSNTKTPGQTAMKELFKEAPQNQPKTPNQVRFHEYILK